ncbi:MAG: response regulator [Alphaproteobacteria bacterium]|nr:response regulator [Alphaproteobacteria bacterium]
MVTRLSQRSLSIFPYLLVRVLPVAAVVMAVAGFLGLLFTEDLAEKKADELLIQQSENTHIIIDFRLKNILSQAQILSESALLVNGLIDHEGRNTYLPAFFQNLQLAGHPGARVELTDYKGRVVFDNKVTSKLDLKSTDWLKTVINETGTWLSLTSGGMAVISPVRYLGNAEGAVTVTLDKSSLATLFDVGVQVNQTVVLDGQEQIIYSSDPAFGVAGQKAVNNADIEWRQITAPLTAFPAIRVLTVQRQETALAGQKWMRNFLVAGLLIALAALCAAIGYAALLAGREVVRLSGIVQKIGETQDLGRRVELSGPAELISLGENFNNMLERLESTTTSLEYVDSIVSNSAEGIITISATGEITTFNQTAEDMFGYRAEQVLGQNVAMLMPTEERADHQQFVDQAEFFAPRIINRSRDLYGLRSDNTLFPLELNVAPMRVGDERSFVGIMRDITERLMIDRAKSEFVSTVSHELRTPLTSIKGSLGLIRSGAVGDLPDKLQSMLNIAYRNSERLVMLINDILDIEKMEAGKMDFHMKPVEMINLIDEAIESNKAYGDEHGVTFVRTGADDQVLVSGDSGRLIQVMSNLMSNAAKFSHEKEQVIISVTGNGDTVRISVIDKGPGIPEEFRANIFEKFSQADSSDTRKVGGSGLGLSITKAIVETHQGTIGFDTETGEGSEFWFELPTLDRKADTQYIPVGENRPRILICEDEKDVAEVIQMLLTQAGFDTEIAYTAAQAREKLTGSNFDAMTLDLALPDCDGLTLMQELREDEQIPNLPIVVVSASANEGKLQVEGSAINVIDWIVKPIEPEALVDRLSKSLRPLEDTTPRILHVEDDDSVLDIVHTLVSGMGYLTSARSLKEARSLLETEAFDLVLLDLMLPDGRGESLLPLLSSKDGKTIPVVVFSAIDVSRETARKIQVALVKSRTSNEELLEVLRSTIKNRKKT